MISCANYTDWYIDLRLLELYNYNITSCNTEEYGGKKGEKQFYI